MTPPPSYDPDLLRSKRVQVQRKVSLKFKNLQGFVTELSENISMGGMFVRTDQPQKPGSLFDFELNLRDDEPLIQGIGEVVWVREESEGEEHPAGMGVRFLELAPGGRALIYKMVDEHISKGGTPFDLDASSPGAGQQAPDDTGDEADDRATAAPGDEPGGTGGRRTVRPGGDTDWPTKVFQPPEPAPAADVPEPPPRPVRASSYAHLASPQGRTEDEESGGRRSSARRSHGGSRWLIAALVLVLLAAGGWALWSWWAAAPSGAGGEPTAAAAGEAATRRDYRPASRLPVAPAGSGETDSTETASPETNAEEAEAAAEQGATAEDRPSGEDPEDSAEPPPDDVPSAAQPAPQPRRAVPQPPLAGSGRLSELRDIFWRRADGGGLTVVLEADGPIPAGSFDHFRMDEGNPRIVVRLRGVTEPYLPSVTVGEPELDRIRTGHHRRSDGDQLHIVLDIPSPRVGLTDARAQGNRLTLQLRR